MALGAADKAKKKAQENWRKKDREVRNIAQVNARVPIGLQDAFKQFGDLLRDGEKPWEVFAAAFPKDYAAILRAAKPPKQEGRPGRGQGHAGGAYSGIGVRRPRQTTEAACPFGRPVTAPTDTFLSGPVCRRPIRRLPLN
jgi:hypothetical protein